MAHEFMDGLPHERTWHEVAADPDIMAREREMDELAARMVSQPSEELAHRLGALRAENTIAVLTECGVDPENIIQGLGQRSSPHVPYMIFKHAGRDTRLTLHGDMTEVSSTDQRLSDKDRFSVAHAYLVCRGVGCHPDDPDLPAHTAKYVQGVLRGVQPLQAEGSFNERYGFVHYVLESPRASWSLPVAVGIAGMSTEEALNITAPSERGECNKFVHETPSSRYWHGDNRFITVPGPGTLVSQSEEPVAWRLDEGGVVQEGRPLDTDPMGSALMRLLETMRS